MADKNDRLTTGAGAPVADNNHVLTAGPRGPMLMQDVWFQEKLAHFDREVIPERRMHAKGSGAYGTFTVTHDVTQYTRASLFAEVGKKTEVFARFSTVAGERGAADAERDIRGFALKFYTDQGNWDMVGNNTPVFFLRDPLKFPDLNHVVKRNPRTNMHSAKDNWDFWTLLPEALPSLINGSAVSAITILGYSAMSGAVGGGGLGKLAIMYGYNRYQTDIMVMTVVLLIIIVQAFQSFGNWATRRSDKRGS